MKTRNLTVLTIGHLFTDMNQGLLPALLPFLIAKHNLDYAAAAGLVFSANMMSSIIQPLFGYLADRISTFYVLPIGVLLAGLGMAAAGTVADYWTLFFTVAVSGVGIAAFHPEGARLANYASGEKKGTGMSTFTAGGNIGIAMGPLAGIAVVAFYGLNGTILFAVPTIFVAALLIANKNNLCPMASKNPAPSEAALADEWGSFGRLSVVITLRSIIIFGINTFLPLYWITVYQQSAATASSLLTLVFITGAFTSLAAGRLADHFGHRTVVRAGFLLLVPAMLLFTHTHNILLAISLLIPIAIALFASFSPMVVLGQKYLPSHMGLASGVTLGLAVSIGGTTAPLLGHIADLYGIETTLAVISVLPILCLAAALFLPKPRIDEDEEREKAQPALQLESASA